MRIVMNSCGGTPSSLSRTPLALALAGALALAPLAAHAATVQVTSPNDTNPAASTTCTLRQAIVSMNANSVMGTACVAIGNFGSSDTIVFDTNTFPADGSGVITLADAPANALIVSAENLTIDASANGNVTIQRARPASDDTNAFGVIVDAASSGSLTLDHLTITNGNARLTTEAAGGGGIACYCASLTLAHSTVTGNAVYGTIVNTSGATLPSGFGGGVFVYGGALTISDSTITGNSAYGYGGGIGVLPPYNGTRQLVTLNNVILSNNTDTGRHGGGAFLRASATITGSTIANNTTTGNGGGLQVAEALTVSDSRVSGNHAGNSGGGMKVYGVTTLTDATISGNTAVNNGGGILAASGYYGVPAALLTLDGSTLANNAVTNVSGSRGGGIFTRVGNIKLVNSTLSGNAAPNGFGFGGGMYVKQNDEPITLLQTTVAGNVAARRGGGLMIMTSGAGAVSVNATLFANTDVPATGGGNIAITTGGINIVGDHNLVFPGNPPPSDVINATFTNVPLHGDPKLTPLANFGGSTPTMFPLAGSAAMDAITPASGQCPAPQTQSDQRGVARPQGAACDIGAVEVDAATQDDIIFINGFDQS